MTKSPLTLLSLAARKLFEEQYCEFVKLYPPVRRSVARKLAAIFVAEGEELSKELDRIKTDLAGLLECRSHYIMRTMRKVLGHWTQDVQRAVKLLKLMQTTLASNDDWRFADLSFLTFFTESSRRAIKGIPLYIREAKHPEPVFLFAKFAFYFSNSRHVHQICHL